MRIEYGSEYISNDYVWKWDNGKPMRPDTLSNRFRRLIEENNLPPLTFHGLRHSCASILLSQGCSIKQIQDWLGHEDIQTTADIYSHRILISNRNRQQKYERKATLFGRREGFLSATLFGIGIVTQGARVQMNNHDTSRIKYIRKFCKMWKECQKINL